MTGPVGGHHLEVGLRAGTTGFLVQFGKRGDAIPVDKLGIAAAQRIGML